MTSVITMLCPTCLAELLVGWSEALVWCPRCATHHDQEFLDPRDETPCPGCGHRRSAHGRHHGYTYACGLSTCGCRHQPKEKPMTDTKTDHRAEAERYLKAAEGWMHPRPGHVGVELDVADRIAGRAADLLAANTHALLADPPVSVVRLDAP
jgi:hypothetical protein